jgi:transcriptional regulator with XRE-family HTH domain
MSSPKKHKGTESLPFKSILSSLMKERDLTLKQVAELAGVSASVVQNWLEGKNPHDLQAVSKLAKSLGVSFKSLLLGEPESNQKPGSIAELFEEQQWFDGYAKITISRLLPRQELTKDES